MAEKKNFVMFDNWAPIFQTLSDEQAGVLIKALYAKRAGQEVSFDDPVLYGIFMMMASLIDESYQHYREKCEKNRENILKRWNTSEEKEIRNDTTENDRIPSNTNEYNPIPPDNVVYDRIHINKDKLNKDKLNENDIGEDKSEKQTKTKKPNAFPENQMKPNAFFENQKNPDNDNDNDNEYENEGQDHKDKGRKPITHIKPEVVYDPDPELDKAIHEFEKYRKDMHKPMVGKAMQLFLNNLERISGGDKQTKLKLMDTAIEHGWMTVYEPHDGKQYARKNNSEIDDYLRSVINGGTQT